MGICGCFGYKYNPNWYGCRKCHASIHCKLKFIKNKSEHASSVWPHSQQLGMFDELLIARDVSSEQFKRWYFGDWGPSPVEIYEEEKEMKEVNKVRVIGVTFNVNTHNGNDRRVFQYLCPFNVKAGDVVVADTVYGASLARVVKVDNFDANNSCYYTGLKTVISGPIDLVLSKNYAVREATEMVRECEDSAIILEKIRKLENKRSKLRKDLEKTECERSFIYRELGDIQSEVCNLKRKAGISLE